MLDRAKAKVDVVGMLLERRIFAQEVAGDSIESIHCYSDGSPVVGAELQGMLADVVHRDRSIRKITMPGSTLHYGHCDAINKCLAFLWAVWLVAGPGPTTVRTFVWLVRSFTTDFGIEMGIVLCPDVLDAFFAWLQGRDLNDCRLLVHLETRLFCRCLRIVGWNHSCGALTHGVAKVAVSWPEILQKVQALCKMFRNTTWREWIAKAVGNRVAGGKKSLEHFTATTAKWRFETHVTVLEQLAPLRQLCQEHVRESLFTDAQDKALVQTAVNARRDAWLWKYIVYSLKLVFFTPRVGSALGHGV